jgi:hypothetical protein
MAKVGCSKVKSRFPSFIALPMNFERYYDLETYLLDEVGPNFRDSGALAPLDFYFILTCKANRSKTATKKRLEKLAGSFSSAVSSIASDLAERAPKKQARSDHAYLAV